MKDRLTIVIKIWIFVATILLLIGLGLIMLKLNISPLDSSAAVVTNAQIKLVPVTRNVPSTMHNIYNINEEVKYQVTISGLADNHTYKSAVLRFQVENAYLENGSNLFEVDSSKYLKQEAGVCTPLNSQYTCNRLDIAVVGETATLQNNEVIATITLKAKAITTTGQDATIRSYPIDRANFNKDAHSYLGNTGNSAIADNFDNSPDGSKNIIIEDWCYGDYNRTRGASNEIVDLLDLSGFAARYGINLSGEDLWYDIDGRNNSNQKLDLLDLSLFATNYGVTSCNRRKSQGPN